MTRIKTAGIAAGISLALVVGVLAGSVLSTAQAEGPSFEVVRTVPSDGPTGVPGWVLDALAERYGADTKDTDRGEPEAVQCSIVDGCTVEVVDAKGTVIKVMSITFSDVGEADVSE